MSDYTVEKIFNTTAPLQEDLEYENSAYNSTLGFRWINANMCELKLPGGKTFIIDPFYTEALPGTGFAKLPRKITIDDFDACDYIFINHAHPDHYLNLKEFVDRFHPLVFVDSNYAHELSRILNIELAHIYPVEVGHSYYFRDFRLETYHGIHNEIKGISFGNYAYTEKLFGVKGTKNLDQYGSLFNTSIMLTLQNGFKIGFAAGVDIYNQAEEWRYNKPDLLLRQRMVYATPEDYAEEVAMLGGQIVLPIHHETAFTINANMHEFTKEVNAIFRRKGIPTTMFNPERLKWYIIHLGISIK